MADHDETSYQDSPKKALKECSMMQKTLQADRKHKKAEQADFIDLNKKQHYMPRRYDVSEMIKDHQTIHEILEEDVPMARDVHRRTTGSKRVGGRQGAVLVGSSRTRREVSSLGEQL